MRTFSKVVAMVAATAFTYTTAEAQMSLGEDCGCPDLASRTVVSLSDNGITSDATIGTESARAFPAGRTDLTCDNVYIINDKIYVPGGAQVYIEPGTVLKGTNDPSFDADAFIVSRDGQLFANGTECCPIIFTSAGDVPSSTNITDPLAGDPLDGTYPLSNRGEWGGLIMLGNAPNNLLAADGASLTVTDGVGGVEGLDVASSRNWYGGSDSDDNSGILRYVSVRHGGIQIALDNEINGITLGSVGRGTTIEHVEVVANGDDGIEWFGGTVDVKYAAVMFCGDDGFDWDQGFSGRGQYWYSVENGSDKGWEIDGDDGSSTKPFYSNPTVYNATMIGDGSSGDIAISAKSETQGTIANSIFTNHETGLNIGGSTTRSFFDAGDFTMTDNLWENMGTYAAQDGAADATLATELNNRGNAEATGIIDYVNVLDLVNNTASNGYDPVPEVGTPGIISSNLPPNDGWFDVVNFKGAFKPGAEPWTAGWSVGALVQLDNSLVECPTDVDRDGDTDVDDLLQLIGSYNTSCTQ